MEKLKAGKYRLKPGCDHYVSGGTGQGVARKVAGDVVELTEDQANTPALIRKFEPADPASKSKTVIVVNDEPLKTDGPTFEEYVAGGYKAESYPPRGYAVVSSPGYTEYLEKATKPEIKE